MRILRPVQTLTIMLLLAGASRAQDVSRMEEVVQSYVPRQFMGSVLVARGADVLLSKGYGSANLEWNIANSPSTKFRLGSITKQFTAASILLLEERGKLKVEDPVKKYMPDAPAAWDRITIFNVLTHTAGIPNFTNFPEYASTQSFPTTPEKLVARFRDKPLDFEPGEKWNYSNSGYVLLGYLIEKISGVSYAKFVQDNIFTPLNMNDSGYDSNTAVIARRAAGYAPRADGPVNAGYVDMSIPYGAGALYSTTEDLLRWEQALFGGKLLTPESLQKMTTPFKSDYAFGLMVHTVNGRKVIEHNGGIEGFNTAMSYFPETKVTIVVLGNLNGQAPDEIAAKLAPLAHGETIQLTSERKEVALSPQVLAAYVGTYQIAPGVDLKITLENDQLMGQLPGQRKFPYFAESESKFFLKVVDAQVEFAKDSAGKITEAILHQAGRDVKATRVSDTVQERKEITLASEILARYVGVYALAPNFDITITIEGNQLMAQATNQNKFPIFPESETNFFAKVVDIQIEFSKDQNGEIKQLTLHQGPVPARTALRK